MSSFVVVIMAGGLGKRMKSDLPKVLHPIRDKPMLIHVIEETLEIHPEKIYIVVGKFREIIEKTVISHINHQKIRLIEYIDQPEPLGTGHAIQCAKSKLEAHPENKVLILSGDVPFIRHDTMMKMIDCAKVKIMTTKMDNPHGYGRIIRSHNKEFVKIVEEKDCTEDERKVCEVNCGIYAFQSEILCSHLSSLKNENSQHEYYLTDIFKIIKMHDDVVIETMEIEKQNQYQIMGVNTIDQLHELESITSNPYGVQR